MIMLHCQSLKEIRVSTPAENRVGNSSLSKGFHELESPGGGGTPLYGPYRYVRPQRVGFFSRFGHK